MTTLDALECSVPSTWYGGGYLAPQAQRTYDPKPAFMKDALCSSRRVKRRPRGRRAIAAKTVDKRHLNAVLDIIGDGELNTMDIAAHYTSISLTTVLHALHNLEDLGLVMRAGYEKRQGTTVIWRRT